ncbi:MAG: 3-methylitaconate isomerase, partial [Chloroflexi bacterium]|nr:3-methylitaconate isomerase [Chloroflexota bacterium]
MPQVAVRAAFYRGGTSRAVIFREDDLARFSDAERRAILLAALGSPDPYGREVDGLGGGISSLSKAAIVGRAPPGSDADVTFRFAQVDVARPLVELLGTCGNISAAVGPFAVDEGMVASVEPVTTVRVLSVNTGQRYVCHVPVRGGRAEVEGDYEIDGVPGRGARIELEFLEPGGSLGHGVLPTGRVVEEIKLADGRTVEVSIVDAANPMVFVRATDIGASATELPEAIDQDERLHATLDEIRDHAAVRVGLARTPDEAHERAKSIPKVVMVAPPADYVTTRGTFVRAESVDVVTRMLSVGKTHRTIAGTAAICAAVASAVRGSIVHDVSGTAGLWPVPGLPGTGQ